VDSKKLIEGYDVELCDVDCVPEAQGAIYSAKAHFADDASEVMPYLNVTLERANYGRGNQFILWKEEGRTYALRQDELAISNVLDRRQAQELLGKALAMINAVWEKRDELTPDYEERTAPQVLEVFKLLPKTNCGECGVASCMAFAVAISEGSLRVDDCPPLRADENAQAVRGLRELGL